MRAAAVVPAGGAGLRMGQGSVRKQYAELAGEAVLLRSLRPFLAHTGRSDSAGAAPEPTPPTDRNAGVLAEIRDSLQRIEKLLARDR